MEANRQPDIVIEGIEEIIRRDLEKHQVLLRQANRDLLAFKEARAHEIKRKKYYGSLIGGGKFDDEALQASMDQIAINIRHLSDKGQLAAEKIEHHTLIVDTLAGQLKEQEEALAHLATYRKDQLDAINH